MAIIGSVRAAWGKCKDMEIIRGGFWAAIYFREGSVNWEHLYENQAFGRSPRRWADLLVRGLCGHKMRGQLPISELIPEIRLTSPPESTGWKRRTKYLINESWVWLYWSQKLCAFSVFLRYLLIYLCHPVLCLSKTTHDLPCISSCYRGG